MNRLNMLGFAVSTFVTALVVIDPLGMLPIFMTLTSRQTAPLRRKTAIRSILVAALTLVIFAIVGDAVFHFLGISVPAFQIAGGLLLLLLSTDMVLVRQSGIRTATKAETDEAATSADVAVFPLAIPLIAGPGAMTTVILLMNQAKGDIVQQALAIAILIIVLFLCLLTFLLASKLTDYLGKTGINVVGRIFGIILAGLAVQYILDGLAATFPALVGH